MGMGEVLLVPVLYKVLPKPVQSNLPGLSGLIGFIAEDYFNVMTMNVTMEYCQYKNCKKKNEVVVDCYSTTNPTSPTSPTSSTAPGSC